MSSKTKESIFTVCTDFDTMAQKKSATYQKNRFQTGISQEVQSISQEENTPFCIIHRFTIKKSGAHKIP